MLDFPDTPYPGQVFREWKWDGTKWVAIPTTGFAPIYSPDFEGMPTAPTPPPGSNDAKIATTAFVMQAIAFHTAGVASFNNRTGHVHLELTDIFEAGGAPLNSPHFEGAPEADTPPEGDDSRRLATTEFVQRAVRMLADGTVRSFNGRIGDVLLTWTDVSAVGGAPITSPQFLGSPRAPTPTENDRSDRLATTEFVAHAVDNLADDVDNEFDHSVRSFNQRTGNVEFRPSDLSAVGGAFLDSPHFTGIPTAPTAPPHTDSSQLATTRYVDDAIASNPGPPGPPGHTGPQGIPGQGYRLKGSVPDIGDLPSYGNAIGDTWIVSSTGEGYTWTGAVWAPVGQLRGPAGETKSTISATAPENPMPGDFWTSPTGTSVWNGSAWVAAKPPVPPGVPTTAPTSFYLDSAGQWAVPGTNIHQTSTSYTALPTDDVIRVELVGAPITITLPVAPDGKIIWINIYVIDPGASVTITNAAGNLQVLTADSQWTLGVNALTITGPIPAVGSNNSGFQLMAIAVSGTWRIINLGSLPQVTINGAPANLPGTVSPRVNVQTFTASGTYTPSPGLAYAMVECWGAGGAGASVQANSGSVFAGGGGASAGYLRAMLSAAQIGASQSVTLGSAGAGNTSATTGGNGGDTTFGTLLTAKGGEGASGLSPGNAVFQPQPPGGLSITGLAGAFGFMALSNLLIAGLGGGGSSSVAAVGTGSSLAGQAGTIGRGGNGAVTNDDTTTPAGTWIVGGNGAAGLCVVTEYLF